MLVLLIIVLAYCIKFLTTRLSSVEKTYATKCEDCRNCSRDMAAQINAAQTQVSQIQHHLTDNSSDFAQTLLKIAATFSDLLAKIQK